jgi:hypothetical protein
MEILPHYYFSWIVSFQKQRHTREMLPLETKQSGGKLLPHSDLRGRGVLLGEISSSRSDCNKTDISRITDNVTHFTKF